MTYSRSEINYEDSANQELSQAYQDGIYDATLAFLSKSACKITGVCNSQKEVKQFCDNMSFGDSLSLIASGEKDPASDLYTQLLLASPRDNRRELFATIVKEFLNQQFANKHYVFVEHTDTDILHYHVLVQQIIEEDELAKLRTDFINLCIEKEIKIL